MWGPAWPGPRRPSRADLGAGGGTCEHHRVGRDRVDPSPILAVIALAAAGLAGANTSSQRARRLVLKSRDPATVSGTGFKPRSRVRVTFVGAQTFVRRPVTNSLGAFTATFPTVVDRCTAFSVSASQPGRPTVVLKGAAKPECAPPLTTLRPAAATECTPAEVPAERRGRDSNPRSACTDSGFQDQRIRPLCHPSTGLPARC